MQELENPVLKCWLKTGSEDADRFLWHYGLNGVEHSFGPEFIGITWDNKLMLYLVYQPEDGPYRSPVRFAKIEAWGEMQ